MSTRFFKNIKNNGYILLNNMETKLYKTAWEDDIIMVEMGEEEIDAVPNPIPINVVYEDHDILLINKEPGIVVHPTRGHINNTLANAIAYYWSSSGISCKIRFANRLDMDTSGLILIGKNKFAQQNIQEQMIANKVKKIYWAFVEGILKEKEGTINAPIGRVQEGDIMRRVLEEGRNSITHYKVIGEYHNASMVEIQLETGRTHQIRVHMEHIGHPLIGDTLYNNASSLIDRQALHSRALGFKLPRSGTYMEFTADLPKDLLTLHSNLAGESL